MIIHFLTYVLNPLQGLTVADDQLQNELFLMKAKKTIDLSSQRNTLIDHFRGFIKSFDDRGKLTLTSLKMVYLAIANYDAVRYFEDIDIQTFPDDSRKIPDVLYQVYQYVIAINHFKNELYIFQHSQEGQNSRLYIG